MLKIDLLNKTYLVTEKIDTFLDFYKTFLLEETEFLFEQQKEDLWIDSNGFSNLWMNNNCFDIGRFRRSKSMKAKINDFLVHHFYLIRLEDGLITGGKCVSRQPLLFEHRDEIGLTSKRLLIDSIKSYIELQHEDAMKIFYSLKS
jgi:hypothetical protein